jgi:NADP-dependent 3-hydroxy acid dehydrogenase YdfG
MTTIAIVGAGPGLGAAAARRFGAEGFRVALLARTQERLDKLVADVAAEGHTVRGYAADVRDRTALTAALDRVAQDLGPVEVMQYSPLPPKEIRRPLAEITGEDLIAALEFSILGAVAATEQVLPGMRALGRGSILFVNGGNGARPDPDAAGTSISFAGEGAYARMLYDTLGAAGIHVAQLIIPGVITAGDPAYDPGVLADRLWQMHQRRDDFQVFAGPMPDAT